MDIESWDNYVITSHGASGRLSQVFERLPLGASAGELASAGQTLKVLLAEDFQHSEVEFQPCSPPGFELELLSEQVQDNMEDGSFKVERSDYDMLSRETNWVPGRVSGLCRYNVGPLVDFCDQLLHPA
ncbi:hypothetical protein H106_04592 [Trichophyton rubrum CBS 735.88]|nr:hypothetical protein H106_04592 [Trichophyton rubrum CBS 735.88]